MDEGPFRVSRPADKRGVNRPGPTPQRQPEQRPLIKAEPQPANQPPASNGTKEKKADKQGKLPFIGAVVGIILLATIGIVWFGVRSTDTSIDTSKYQAIWLTNDQYYFGKLESINDKYFKLTDVYYLQTEANQKTETDTTQSTPAEQASTVKLIKLGDNELHGPEDQMTISKDQVLFYENLRPSGKVAQSIEQDKKAK